MAAVSDYPLQTHYLPETPKTIPSNPFSDLAVSILTKIASMLDSRRDLASFRISYEYVNRLPDLKIHFNLYHTLKFTAKELKNSASHLSLLLRRPTPITESELLTNFSPNVEELDLSHCILASDILISLLRGAPKLRVLILKNSPLLDTVALRFILENCEKLEVLDVSGSNHLAFVHEEGSDGRRLPLLRELHLENCGISNEYFEYMCAKCPNLELLNLSQNELITDKGMTEAIPFFSAQLRELRLSRCFGIKGLSFKLFENLPMRLTHLDLCGCHEISKTAFAFLRNISCDLQVLNVKGTQISGIELLELISLVSSLRILNISRCDSVGDADLLNLLRRCRELKDLDVSYCTQIGKGFFRRLPFSCPNIDSLNISFCPNVKAKILARFISDVPKLSSLYLAGEHLKDRHLRALVPLPPTVHGLYLSQTNFTRQGLDLFFSKVRHLTSLICSGCSHFSDRHLEIISKQFPHMTHLDVSECGITDEGLGYISQAFKELSYLNLKKCSKLSANGLLSFIEESSELHTLDVSNCAFDTNKVAFAIFKNCKKLKFLFLNNSESLNDGAFAEFGASEIKLEHLEVNGCPQLTNLFLEYISRNADSLKYLSLLENRTFTVEGLLSFASTTRLSTVIAENDLPEKSSQRTSLSQITSYCELM